MTERPKTEFELIGERCAQVVNDWAPRKPDGNHHGLSLIAEFCWALGVTPHFSLERRASAPTRAGGGKVSNTKTAFIRARQASGYTFVCPRKDRALSIGEPACEDCDCIADATSPADEKRLAEIRLYLDSAEKSDESSPDHDLAFLLRLLDASRARLAEVERERDHAHGEMELLTGNKWSEFELALADKKAHEMWMGIHGIKSLDDLLNRAEAAEERALALTEALKPFADMPTAREAPGHILTPDFDKLLLRAREALSPATSR